MTRPPLRDVVFGGLLVANGSCLGLHLWGTWRAGATPASTTAIVACSVGLGFLLWSRELVDLWRAVLRAQVRKWEADAQVAERVLAQMREIEHAARPLTLQPPMPRH